MDNRKSLRAGCALNAPEDRDEVRAADLRGARRGRNAEPQRGEGVIDSWLDYTVAIRESGALIGAEQLDQSGYGDEPSACAAGSGC